MADEIDIDLKNQVFIVELNNQAPTISIHINSKVQLEEAEAISKIIFVDFKRKTRTKFTFEDPKPAVNT